MGRMWDADEEEPAARRGRRRALLGLAAAMLAAALLALVVASAGAINATQAIATVAGTGTAGFAGDGGPAVAAQLDSPTGLDVDPPGGATAANPGLYIVDRQNHRIRRVDTLGVITTVAGTGAPGFTGDGGPAAQAQLNEPAGIALDADGNLYIADTGNHRVRRVDTAGIITTIAGTGSPGFAGDGGPAALAQLNQPTAVVADGNAKLYVADTGNHRVRTISLGGGPIATVAGTGAAGFSGDGGPGTGAQLNAPSGLAYDAEGKALYIADTNNNRVRLVEQSGVIATVAGTGVPGFSGDGGPAAQAQLNAPVGIEYDVIAGDANRDLYVADTANHRVRKIDLVGGRISTVVGSGAAGFAGDGGQAGAASLNAPRGVALDANGNLFVADTFNERVRRVANLSPIARFTATPVQGPAPLRVAVDAAASRDPQGGALKYAWDFGEAGATAPGATAAHTYSGAGRYVIKLTVTDARGAVASASRAVFVGRPEDRAPTAPACAGPAVVEPPPAEPGEGEEEPPAIELKPGQLLINQRISQAAVRRANGIQAWFDAGIETRDICGNALTGAAFDAGVRLAATSETPSPGPASPRPVVSKAPSGGGEEGAGRVTLSVRQLLINQRISQAAVRRTNALKARLDAGLSGGDIRDGAITLNKLEGLTVLSASPPAKAQVRTVTRLAPAGEGDGRVTLSTRQLRINQRISQAAVRRANALIARLERGLTSADFKRRTITALDFAPGTIPSGS
jgi:sugar lactone lactonase YvrE